MYHFADVFFGRIEQAVKQNALFAQLFFIATDTVEQPVFPYRLPGKKIRQAQILAVRGRLLIIKNITQLILRMLHPAITQRSISIGLEVFVTLLLLGTRHLVDRRKECFGIGPYILSVVRTTHRSIGNEAPLLVRFDVVIHTNPFCAEASLWHYVSRSGNIHDLPLLIIIIDIKGKRKHLPTVHAPQQPTKSIQFFRTAIGSHATEP